MNYWDETPYSPLLERSLLEEYHEGPQPTCRNRQNQQTLAKSRTDAKGRTPWAKPNDEDQGVRHQDRAKPGDEDRRVRHQAHQSAEDPPRAKLKGKAEDAFGQGLGRPYGPWRPFANNGPVQEDRFRAYEYKRHCIHMLIHMLMSLS